MGKYRGNFWNLNIRKGNVEFKKGGFGTVEKTIF
jgi:hypothetical protein